MCECIKTIEQKVFDHIKDDLNYKKPVISVRMKGKMLSLKSQLSLKITSDFEIELEGQKKKPTIPVTWSYCAWCGEKLSG